MIWQEILLIEIKKANQFVIRDIFTNLLKGISSLNPKKNSIDKINRKSFIENLKKYLKYEFASENELIEFADNIFSEMHIIDDDDHYIKLRDEYQHDYILKTSSKNPQELYNELKSIIL